MSVQLLDKTRKINKLLHNNSSSKVVFNDICQVLTNILNSNILVLSRKGKVLGVSQCEGVEEIQELISSQVGDHIDEALIIKPLSPPLILPASGLVLFFCISTGSSMILTTLF